MPSATRPQRPARWLADACETASIGRRCTLRRAAVAGDAGGAGVDHVADAGHGQRRLGHVGGQHDAPALVRGEHPVLLGRRQPGVERQDLGVGQVEGPQRVGGVADLPLAGQEHEHVARAPRAAARATASAMAGDLVAAARRRRRRVERPVAHLDRVGAAGHLDDRAPSPKWRGEALGLDGGRGDDDLEVGPAGQQLGQVAEDEVDVEAALVGLVDDDRVVGRQRRGRGAARPAGCRRSSA